MADTADLKAQLKALEEQLERKRLEDEIAQLQLKLAGAASKKQAALAPTPTAVAAANHDEEEYDEEEFIEEYEEEEYDEEVIDETAPPENEVSSAPPAKAHSVEAASANVSAGSNRRSIQPPANSRHTGVASSQPSPKSAPAPSASAGSSSQQQSKAAATAAMYDELRQLEEELRRKQLEEELKALEQQAASMNVAGASEHSKPSVFDAPSSTKAPMSTMAKPAGPFKQRVIPNMEASPTGQETPMELLIGPKLYKNGKLIATTTRAACDGQQLMLLFFAASWNRLCKPFFPKLQDFYKLVNQVHGVECIYVSTDRNLNEFKEAFAKMPYVAMPTGTADYKNRIAKELKILEVPFLIVLDVATAHVITTNGVDLIDRLERGNWNQANALVEDWKRATPVPLEQVQLDTRLVNGVMERGILYWHS